MSNNIFCEETLAEVSSETAAFLRLREERAQAHAPVLLFGVPGRLMPSKTSQNQPLHAVHE